ncbi:uncharacterized protein LOC123565850 [Mercenaria mercenaria]|uniref:uncharacterized protein LOC123565850 n=1 Tax=Mercenaria mercenaria TaxID=6596 RepID=UPI001E1DFAA2|nr:uncharacterized protein LOC123565850 [Mercenaria mercenaria]
MSLVSSYLQVVVAALCTAHQCTAGITSMSCVDVKHLCMEKVGCSMAWHNYHIHCQNAIDGDVQTCTVSCQRAITVLLSAQDGIGRLFTNCSCNVLGVLDSCDEQRRLNFCSQFVLDLLETLDDSAVVGCSAARIMCEADAACHTAFQMYMSQCESMIKGLECKKECEDSLNQLYKENRAAKLKSCICDNDPEYKDCETVHRNMNIDVCKYQNNTYKVLHNAANAEKVHYGLRFSFIHVMIFYFLRICIV